MNETLDQAYEFALAALTAPVSFVEWTTLKVENSAAPNPFLSDDWSPLGLELHYHEGYEWEPTQPIEGERYIYVFARRAFAPEQTLTLVEELHLFKDGHIEAATLGARRFPDPRALDAKDSPLPEKRDWADVGRTLRFVRRYRGARMLHYFFAARIPLRRKHVERLRHQVELWAPATMFDDYGYVLPAATSDPKVSKPSIFGQWDPNIVTTEEEPRSLEVAVLDPLTIVLHLHTLAYTATNDLYNYISVDDRQSLHDRHLVERRQYKMIIGSLITAVMKDYKIGNDLELKSVKKEAGQFVRQYWEQVDHRSKEADRWWRYLANWYQSDPIHFLAEAHNEEPPKYWLAFLLPMLASLPDLNSNAHGRELATRLVEDEQRFRWFQLGVLQNFRSEFDQPLADWYQIPREALLAVLSGIKETMPAVLKHDPSTETLFRILGRLEKYKVSFFIAGVEGAMQKILQVSDPHEAAKAYASWSNSRLRGRTVDEGELMEDWAEHEGEAHKMRWTKIATFIELMDLGLSLRQYLEERSALNRLTLARSVADSSVILLEYAGTAKGALFGSLFKFQPYVAIAAGILEFTGDVISAQSSGDKHDYVGSTGSVISATGAAISTVGLVGFVLLDTPAPPFAIAGLILMSIGALVRWFSDTPMDTFLKFCAFGVDGGGGDQIVPGLAEMEKGEYAQQLEVLINLICNFGITEGQDPHDDGPGPARFTMGWFDEHSYLMVDYDDEWNVGDDKKKTPRVTKKITLDGRQVTMTDGHIFELAAMSNFPGNAPRAWGTSTFQAQLHLFFGQQEIVVPPTPSEAVFHWPWHSDLGQIGIP